MIYSPDWPSETPDFRPFEKMMLKSVWCGGNSYYFRSPFFGNSKTVRNQQKWIR
jgi:hypothetical protein